MNSSFLNRVIELARRSYEEGGFPNGSLILLDGRIVAESISMAEQVYDPTAHAEVTVIRRACQELRTSTLSHAVLYTSLEPCLMCLHSSYWAGIRSIVYACQREKVGTFCYEGTLAASQVVQSLHEAVKLTFEGEYEQQMVMLHQEWGRKGA
jgi:guanine deaminase